MMTTDRISEFSSIKAFKRLLDPLYYTLYPQKVPDQLLVWGIGDCRKFLMVPSDSLLIVSLKRSPLTTLNTECQLSRQMFVR